MMQRSSSRSRLNGVTLAAAVVAGLMVPGLAHAQVTGSTTTTTDSQGKPQENVTLSADVHHKSKKAPKDERVQQTKDTRKAIKKQDKFNPLIAKDEQLPDKQLYDKALAQEKSGHYDVARLDLETLLNTYPDSQYLMRAKLAVADSWYREGGSASLAQAEQEYKDFITFFPNAPEAAEAQMRVGDIYFKQMDVPDRDYSKAESAEAEYRTMLKQYPDAPPEVLAQAKQKLREVQEVLATREANIGAFYMTRSAWPAAIARFQTVVDTYPQYSHMDDVLIGIGDSYEAQARTIRATPTCAAGLTVPCLPEGAKSRLEQDFDGKAAAAYRAVVLQHAAAPHVEFAKERLAGMNLPIPTPTPEELAASEKLEGSRAQYTMGKRLELLFVHEPDMVTAAQSGEPPLEDPPATVAPTIVKDLQDEYAAALNPHAAPAPGAAEAASKPEAGAADAGTGATGAAAPATPAAPPTLSDVPAAGSSPDATGSVMEVSPASSGGGSAPSTGIGSEIVGSGSSAEAGRDLPAASGKPDANFGLTSVAPKNSTPLPAVEKPADAPDQVNELAGKTQPAVTTPATKKVKKGKAPDYDKDDESSSKHKQKKGLDKLNPF